MIKNNRLINVTNKLQVNKLINTDSTGRIAIAFLLSDLTKIEK
jgi:hypothetical protein